MAEFATSTGVRIRYDSRGSGVPVLLIHGLGFDGTTWAPVAARLAGLYRVVEFDNRCAGLTQGPDGPFGTPDMAEDAAELLAHAVGDEPAHVVGFSMEGMVAQHLASRHPEQVRSLALVSTAAQPSGRTRALFALWRDMALAGIDPGLLLRDQMLWANRDEFFEQPKNVLDALASMAQHPARQAPHAFVRQVTACMEHDSTRQVGVIGAPTLVLVGSEERIFSVGDAERLAGLVPGAQCEILQAGGHNAWMELPDDFVGRLATHFEVVR